MMCNRCGNEKSACVCVEECQHAWRKGTDWMGDPDVPNGTFSWSIWQCTKCGDETTQEPDDYDPNEGRDPDHEREMRLEDREFFEKYADTGE